MEQNKLELKDCCLTIEQAKELQELGVNMSDSMMVHFNLCGAKIICERYNLSGTKDCIDTLTNTEMLEMLPQYIFFNKKLRIYKDENRWLVSYEKDGYRNLGCAAELLRDALFEMIKCLKTNKLI